MMQAKDKSTPCNISRNIKGNMMQLALVVGCALVLAAPGHVLATSEMESFDPINKVVSLLNNRETCTLPTYKHFDEAARSLESLRQTLGPAFEESLEPDHKLLLETILGQWDSFQRYLTSENVLRNSKGRALLCRVQDYQERKFNESICLKEEPNVRMFEESAEEEKNQLVRYVKHVSRGRNGTACSEAVPLGQASDNDVELKFKVHDRDELGNIKGSRQYETKFIFDKSRPQNRITLHIGERR